MIFSDTLRKAVRLSIRTHELNQKQKRKGKDVPYIVHPLIVGMILSRGGADEATIAAGILHDTIEDSADSHKVTKEMIQEKFGKEIAGIVADVSEQHRNVPWDERKKEALAKIATFDKKSLLVKSADLTANISELLYDHAKDGDKIFNRFGGTKEKIIMFYLNAISEVQKRRFNNPMAGDLITLSEQLKKII